MVVCTLYVLCEAYFALAGPTKVHCFSFISAHPVQLCRLAHADMLRALPRCLGCVTFRIQFAPLGRRQVGTQTIPLRLPRGSPSSLISEPDFVVPSRQHHLFVLAHEPHHGGEEAHGARMNTTTCAMCFRPTKTAEISLSVVLKTRRNLRKSARKLLVALKPMIQRNGEQL